MREEARKWTKKAEKVLADAKINLSQGLYEVSAFLSHQAAEKALKALYILKFRRLWKIHDLKELAEKVGANEDILEICDALNPHYIETRYPVEASYTKNMAEDAFKNAQKVVEWTKEKFPEK